MVDRQVAKRDQARRPPVTSSASSNIASTRDTSASEITYGRPATLKVFVSSVMRDGSLETERELVAEILDAHPDTEPWLWERSANAGPYSSLEVCKGHARTSDILLLIVGTEITDVTEAEWHAAQAAGASCAMLRKAKVKPSARLKAFIEIERSRGIDVTFSDLASLRSVTSDAIRRCMTDAVRQRIQRRRLGLLTTPSAHLLEAGVERAEEHYFLGSAHTAAEVLAELDVLVPPGDHRPENLELITGLVQGATGRTKHAIDAYERIIRDESSSHHAKTVAHQNLGLELFRRGDAERSQELMRCALNMYRESKDLFGVLQMVLNLATVALDDDDLPRAIRLADAADDIIAQFGSRIPQEWSALGLRAHIAARLGEHEAALTLYKRAYQGSQRYGDRDAATVGAQNIGAAYRDLGRPTLALRWARRALAVAMEMGAVWRQEEIQRFLGTLAIDRGDLFEAIDCFEAARALAGTMEDTWRAATLQADIGALRVELDDPKAESDLDYAHQTLTDLGDIDWLHRIDLNRSLRAAKDGDHARARKLLDKIATSGDADLTLRQDAYERMAKAELDEPVDSQEALRCFQSALELSSEEAPVKALQSGAYAHQLEEAGHATEAMTLFDEALSLASGSGNSAAICDVTNDRAMLLADGGDLENAMSSFENCEVLARRLNDTQRRVRALHNLGDVASRAGNPRRSRRLLRQAHRLALDAGDREADRSIRGALAITEIAANRLAVAREIAIELNADSMAAGDKMNSAVALGVLGSASFLEEDFSLAAEWYRKAARRNQGDRAQHIQDLQGIAESHAAAGRWRPTLRAVQNVVSFSEAHGLHESAWPALLRAARWYLDRQEVTRAAGITLAAWVLASQVPSSDVTSVLSSDGEPGLEASQFYEALLTTAFHELWSEHGPYDQLYHAVFDGLGQIDDTTVSSLWTLVDYVREVARNTPDDA